MNCALCRVEIAAESAINGTMCARCGAYADGKPAAPPPVDEIKIVPGGVETWRAPPGTPPPLTPARETMLVEDVATMLGEEPKSHHQQHSKKSK